MLLDYHTKIIKVGIHFVHKDKGYVALKFEPKNAIIEFNGEYVNSFLSSGELTDYLGYHNIRATVRKGDGDFAALRNALLEEKVDKFLFISMDFKRWFWSSKERDFIKVEILSPTYEMSDDGDSIVIEWNEDKETKL